MAVKKRLVSSLTSLVNGPSNDVKVYICVMVIVQSIRVQGTVVARLQLEVRRLTSPTAQGESITHPGI